MMDKGTTGQDAAVAAVADVADGRSAHARWLSDHYEALLPVLGSRTDWEAVAVELARYGVTTASGAPVKSGTLRKTWYRIRRARDKAARHVAVKPPLPPRPPVVAAVPAQVETPASPPESTNKGETDPFAALAKYRSGM